MGQTGSFTSKVTMRSTLLPYTKWGLPQLQAALLRSKHELADTFALRQQEFIFLLGRRDVNIAGAIDVFVNVFDSDNNKLADKLEILCVLILASTLSSELKVETLYDTFDFDSKGFISRIELLLLLKIVLTATFKVDKSFHPPLDSVLAEILVSAWRFSERGTESLRKYELVSFAANTPEIRSFLEIWRGQASQVFVVGGQKWQDAEFPAMHLSIAPSKEWLSIGLPPEKFVTWLRRPRLKPSCETLFGHNEKFLKSVNKDVLDGFGALANGTLSQGLLASLWLLNAISTLCSNQKVVMSLFVTTAQEFLGRFCVRLYAGGCWNSVFIDDRIPCTPDGVPIFSTSSFSQECWVLLLEKAFAKFEGSYGHIAIHGKRPDAIEAALRMLTGGHVFRMSAKDFDWKSVQDEVQGEDGTAMVIKLLKEGSLISFGRSEPLLLNRKTLLKYPSVALPHGRLFPVVRIETISNFKCFILKDTFGLQQPRPGAVQGEADPFSGHCRTFVVRAEELLGQFDTLYVVRFPESLRTLTVTGTPSWITKLRASQNNGVAKPALFKLTINSGVSNDLKDDSLKHRSTSNRSTGDSESAINKNDNMDDAAVSLESSEIAHLASKRVVLEKPSEFCLTINSSVEWSREMGDSEMEADLPTLFIRIIPSVETLELLKSQNRDLISINSSLAMNDFNIKNRELMPSTIKNMEKEKSVATDVDYRDNTVAPNIVDGAVIETPKIIFDNRTENKVELLDETKVDITPDGTAKAPASNIVDAVVPQVRDMYSLEYFTRRNWKSLSLNLWPGDYYVVSSVTYCDSVNASVGIDNKLKDAFEKKKNKTLWELQADKGHRLWCQASCVNEFRLLPIGSETGTSASDAAIIQKQYSEEFDRFVADPRNSYFQRERWPFLIEHQLDTGPNGLMNVLYRIRRETKIVMAEVYEMRVQQNLSRQKSLLSSSDALETAL